MKGQQITFNTKFLQKRLEAEGYIWLWTNSGD